LRSYKKLFINLHASHATLRARTASAIIEQERERSLRRNRVRWQDTTNKIYAQIPINSILAKNDFFIEI
jgi:hypothetical protein